MLILPHSSNHGEAFKAGLLAGVIAHQLHNVGHTVTLGSTPEGVVLVDILGEPADASERLPEWARRRLLTGKGLEFQKRLSARLSFALQGESSAIIQALTCLEVAPLRQMVANLNELV